MHRGRNKEQRETAMAAAKSRTPVGKTKASRRSPRVAEAPVRSQRLPREERERRIVQEAIRFFAEAGFGGDTRELAKRVNVTHPLLFRYFPSKDALIERVYQEVYLGRWNPYWETLIEDRSIPIRERMIRFYKLYAKTILTYEWVRLFMFFGLRGMDVNRRWFGLVGDRIVAPICREIRAAHGLPDVTRVPLTPTELELVWGVNSRVFYFGVRKYIYGMPVPDDLDALIEAEVKTFFDGIASTLAEVLAQTARGRLRGRSRRARVASPAP